MTSDYKNKEKLYQLIENLTSSGHIFEAKRKVVLCPCGRIDCLEDSLDSKTGRTNYQESEFHKCKICQRPCLVEEKKVLLEHRTIGGIIDYYFYLGSSVDDTLIKLHDVIGQPMLPPFWSLGFHQCRWGYHNTSEIETNNDSLKTYVEEIEHSLTKDIKKVNKMFGTDISISMRKSESEKNDILQTN